MGRLARVLTMVAALLLLSACEWPVVGSGAARSGSSSIETAITPRNVGQLAEQWRANLVGPGSDPVVDSDQVYVTAKGPDIDNSPGSGLYAFDANGVQGCAGSPKTCMPRWSKFFASTVGPTTPSPSSLSAPAVAGGRVFIGAIGEGTVEFSGPLHAFDAAGAPLFTSGDGAVGSPAPYGSMLYSTFDFVCCLGQHRRGIEVLDAQTGAVRFGAFLPEATPPAVSGNVIYVAWSSELDTLDAQGTQNCGWSMGQSPFPTQCAPLWRGTLTATADPVATPAVANGRVYQSVMDGKLNVFGAAGCGAERCSPLWTDTTPASLHASPAVTQTTAFVASGSALYAFAASGCGAPTCSPTWTATMGGAVRGAPSVAGDVVYIGSDDGHVYAFDARGCGHASCPALWSAATGAAVTTAPAISNGRVFVADTAGTLHTYGLPSS